MALDQAANFVRETVTSAISAGDTTINVADASPFPVPPEGYNIVVWDGAAYVRPDQDPDVEIMRVTDTDTTSDTLTVARGQEGTSDFNHPDTSVVVVAQTAKMIADIASEKISNPVTETVDANGNDVTNVGALDVEDLDSRGGYSNQGKNLNTQYVNDTGSDLDVIVTVEASASATKVNMVFNIDGSATARLTQTLESTERIPISATVPAGSTYEVGAFSDIADYSVNLWSEQS